MAIKNYKKTIISALVLKDVVVVTACWIGAWWIRHLSAGTAVFPKDINPLDTYLAIVPLIIVVLLLTNYGFGHYRRRREVSRLEEIQQYLKAFFLASAIVSALAFFLKEFDLGRSVVAIFVVLSFIVMFIGQLAIRKIEARLRKRGDGKPRALIIGADVTGVLAYGKIIDHPEIGYEVVGFLDDNDQMHGKTIGRGKTKVLGGLQMLRSTVKEHNVDEVVIADPSLEHTEMLNLISENEDLGVDFRVVTDLFDVMVADTRVDLIEELPLIDLPTRDTDFRYRAGKRIFDLLVCLGFLLTIGWLIWPLIVIAIRLDSKGPAHFSQKRVGLYGREFIIYKFRTMFIDTEVYSHSPADSDDPRITRVGKWLRKTSLDELPQLINVLKGDMSIVGPRPEMPFIVEKFDKWQRRRFDVLPGLTGLWQIYGRKDLPLEENIQYDFFYLKHRSFLFDLSILLRTIPAVLFRKGAY